MTAFGTSPGAPRVAARLQLGAVGTGASVAGRSRFPRSNGCCGRSTTSSGLASRGRSPLPGPIRKIRARRPASSSKRPASWGPTSSASASSSPRTCTGGPQCRAPLRHRAGQAHALPSLSNRAEQRLGHRVRPHLSRARRDLHRARRFRTRPRLGRPTSSTRSATQTCSTFRIALKAGFGELGRHGSIIHPEHGPLFRMGSVLSSAPMAVGCSHRRGHRRVL